jgi:peptidoglycan/LPS O-acetylase OafA/YrhL
VEHRKDIDGLRAIAVLAIILFHAGFDRFSGGYVGVDIFFVISGFLITGIILRESAEGRFSLAGFYERRARRILPALFGMLFVTASVAYVLLLPSDLRTVAQDLIAVVLFCSNILFWKRSGTHDFYFEPAARSSPLIHTWSLGVEEQFYLLFPLLMLLGWRLGRRRLFQLVALAALGSFVYSSLIDGEWGLGFKTRPETNFYLLPPRAWQLAAGSLLAFYDPPASRTRERRWRSEAAALFGLGLLLFAVLTFRESEIRFTSIYALAPILGTVLILKYARGTSIGTLLSTPPLVAVGLWSYSAYLWHQPLFAFSHYAGLAGTLSTTVRLALCGATVILAYASWRWVENPFRDRRRVSRRVLAGVCAAASLILLVAGGTLALSRHSPARGRLWSDRLASTLATTPIFEAARDCGAALSGMGAANVPEPGCSLIPVTAAPAEFIVAGDSHAGALLPAFRRIAQRLGQQGRLITTPGCAPLVGIDAIVALDKCRGVQERTLELVKRHRIRRVVLAARWTAVTDNDWAPRHQIGEEPVGRPVPRADFERALVATIDAYAALGVHLYIVEQVPQQIHRPIGIYTRALLGRDPSGVIERLSVTQADHRELQGPVRAAFAPHSGNTAVSFVDLSGALCQRGVCPVGTPGESYYADFTHLSDVGAGHVAAALERLAFGPAPRT